MGLFARIGRLHRPGAELPLGDELFYQKAYAPFRRPAWLHAEAMSGPLVHYANEAQGEAIDLGCGTGRNAFALATRGWRVLGIDLSRRAVTWSAREARERGLETVTDFRVARATRLETLFTRARFGLALDVLGPASDLHFRRLSRYADGLAHVLAPGAKLLLFTFLEREELLPHFESSLTLIEDETQWPHFAGRWFVFERTPARS